jgi:hypothetical protein
MRARAYFNVQLGLIEQLLTLVRAATQAHNKRMTGIISQEVAQQRARLLTEQEHYASIGFPITRRADADSYRVPITQKKITLGRSPGPAPGNRYAPEPFLGDADYEAVLDVIHSARNALERAPSTTAKLKEEEIRDLLLVLLNAQFEGRAAGEVFNGAGKTDILIRDDDRNVFIGECKIIRPGKDGIETVVADALRQLLSYLTPRDTKAALLLLIRDGELSAIARRARQAITEHPDYKEQGKITTDERSDFVMHASGDRNHEIRLALLPFLIAAKDPGEDSPSPRRQPAPRQQQPSQS